MECKWWHCCDFLKTANKVFYSIELAHRKSIGRQCYQCVDTDWLVYWLIHSIDWFTNLVWLICRMTALLTDCLPACLAALLTDWFTALLDKPAAWRLIFAPQSLIWEACDRAAHSILLAQHCSPHHTASAPNHLIHWLTLEETWTLNK